MFHDSIPSPEYFRLYLTSTSIIHWLNLDSICSLRVSLSSYPTVEFKSVLMKFVALVLAAIVAIASAEAAAVPDAAAIADAKQRENFCFRQGETCFKLKRATDAVSEALAVEAPAGDVDPISHYCNKPDGPCYKAKRDALALAAAVANAHASANAAAIPEPDAGKSLSTHFALFRANR